MLADISPRPWGRTDWFVILILAVGLSTLYFATTSGITSSNDGSHYALTRTIVENQTFALKQFDDYAEGNDIAIREGVLYSDRPPGTALWSSLFYRLGGLLPGPLTPLPSRHDADNPRLLYVLLVPVWAGTAAAVLLYSLMRILGVSVTAAFTAVLMFGLGTAHWKYSTVLFSHALSSFFVLLSLWLTIYLRHYTRATWRGYLVLGLVVGYAVLVEYANALLVLIVAGYVLVGLRPFTWRSFGTTFLPFLAGGLVWVSFLAAYNTINFGHPLTLSYAYAVNYPWAGDFRSTFNYPLLDGLQALLIFGSGGGWCDPTCYNQGFLLLSPVLLLALPGLILYGRRNGRICGLTTAVFLIYLLLFARHRTSHGFTADGRYLVPFLGLLILPIGFLVQWIQRQQKRPIQYTIFTFILYGLFFLSVRNIILHIGLSYNYTLDLAQLDPLIASTGNWRYLASQTFRNEGNLPLLWLLEGSILLVLWLARGAARLRREGPQTTAYIKE